MMRPLKTEVKHSRTKACWNVITIQPLGAKYKVAKCEYYAMGEPSIDDANRMEAFEHAKFISDSFNKIYEQHK